MKFTEEQYQKIVEIADEYQSHSAFGIIGDPTQKSIGAIFYESELCVEIDFEENAKEMMAIFNPLTREWAYEQFVEKEKKYVWTLKKVDKSGIKMHLYKDYFGRVKTFLSVTNVNIDDNEKLTEKEIREWGYNPEMFNKEEAE